MIKHPRPSKLSTKPASPSSRWPMRKTMGSKLATIAVRG